MWNKAFLGYSGLSLLKLIGTETLRWMWYNPKITIAAISAITLWQDVWRRAAVSKYAREKAAAAARR